MVELRALGSVVAMAEELLVKLLKPQTGPANDKGQDKPIAMGTISKPQPSSIGVSWQDRLLPL